MELPMSGWGVRFSARGLDCQATMWRPDHQQRTSSTAGENLPHVRTTHGHATCRAIGAIAEQMKEDGAANTFHARTLIVVGRKDNIIRVVGAPHAFADITERQAHLAVILPGGWCFAPAGVGGEGC